MLMAYNHLCLSAEVILFPYLLTPCIEVLFYILCLIIYMYFIVYTSTI